MDDLQKRLENLEKRIADLEGQTQSRQMDINLSDSATDIFKLVNKEARKYASKAGKLPFPT